MNFQQPIIILAAPRSGSTLLFETLAAAKDLYTIGGESHAVIEHIPQLSTVANGFKSNALDQSHATTEVKKLLLERFAIALRDRDQIPPLLDTCRFLEKTPKNALRVPFLNAVFPDALYIHLVRDPVPNISSIMEAWHSGRFRTYPNLPGFDGKWSLLLPDHWQQLQGKSIAEIATYQWAACNHAILEGLKDIPQQRVATVNYEDVINTPKATISSLLQFADLQTDATLERLLDQPLAQSRYTVSAPDKTKAQRRRHELQPYLSKLSELIDKLNRSLKDAGVSPINVET